MRTFIALLAVVAVVAAALAVVARYPVAGRVAIRLGGLLLWPVVALCRLASRFVDLVLSSRRRRGSAWRYVLWAVVALLPMAAFVAAVFWPPPLPAAADPGYLLLLGALVQVLVVGAAFLIVREDFDVMDGVMDADARRIRGAHAATRPAVIALSVAMVVAYAVAIAWWLIDVEGLNLVAKRPYTGVPGLDYVLIALRALPADYLLGLLDRITGDDTSVVFSPTLLAQAYYFIAKGVGSVLLVGLVAIGVQEAWQFRRIVTEIGESDTRRDYLIQRALLAPRSIRSGILRAAVTPAAAEKQRRLIVAAKEIGIFRLPQTFCRYLESFDSEIQIFGLEQCLEMFRHRARDFTAEQCDATFRQAARVFRRGKLGGEPVKKLLRLMTSILVVKRGSVDLSPALRATVAATIKREIDLPRAKEDPALRGFLRDLQSALNGSQPPVNKVAALDQREDWLKRLPPAADPAAPPDSPTPTVH